MCPICHWPVEPDPSVRSQTRSSREGCEDARANVREPDPILRTHTRFTRKGYEDAMAPAGSHVHKRWLDRDPYSDCEHRLYYFCAEKYFALRIFLCENFAYAQTG